MGLIKSPWISKEWFDKCPFNYCDHFGDKELLASVCKICKSERQERLSEEAEEDIKNAQMESQKEPDIFLDSTVTLERETQLEKELNEVFEEEKELAPAVFKLLNLLRRYGNQIAKILFVLSFQPVVQDNDLLEKAKEVFTHSRSCTYVKISRAWSSLLEEQNSEISEELADSKTSALFAYVAIERNSRAFLALAREQVDSPFHETYLDLTDISLELMEFIKQIFFPREKLKYIDLGCEEYDACFAEKKQKVSKH